MYNETIGNNFSKDKDKRQKNLTSFIFLIAFIECLWLPEETIFCGNSGFCIVEEFQQTHHKNVIFLFRENF